MEEVRLLVWIGWKTRIVQESLCLCWEMSKAKKKKKERMHAS
jgi:hypothetical protein